MLQHGGTIMVGVVQHAAAGIDTPAEYCGVRGPPACRGMNNKAEGGRRIRARPPSPAPPSPLKCRRDYPCPTKPFRFRCLLPALPASLVTTRFITSATATRAGSLPFARKITGRLPATAFLHATPKTSAAFAALFDEYRFQSVLNSAETAHSARANSTRASLVTAPTSKASSTFYRSSSNATCASCTSQSTSSSPAQIAAILFSSIHCPQPLVPSP